MTPFTQIMADYYLDAESLVLSDIALIQSNAQKGIFPGTRWQSPASYNMKAEKSRVKLLKDKNAFESAVKQALQLKQMQLSILKTIQSCKSSKDLNEMFEKAMAQMCPHCKGGMVSGIPHCRSGKDVLLFLTCSLLFAAIKFEIIVRKREEATAA